VPATIAVLEGVPHVGLTQEQLQHIAQRGPAVRSCFGAALCYCASVVLHLTSDAHQRAYRVRQATDTTSATGSMQPHDDILTGSALACMQHLH